MPVSVVREGLRSPLSGIHPNSPTCKTLPSNLGRKACSPTGCSCAEGSRLRLWGRGGWGRWEAGSGEGWGQGRAGVRGGRLHGKQESGKTGSWEAGDSKGLGLGESEVMEGLRSGEAGVREARVRGGPGRGAAGTRGGSNPEHLLSPAASPPGHRHLGPLTQCT